MSRTFNGCNSEAITFLPFALYSIFDFELFRCMLAKQMLCGFWYLPSIDFTLTLHIILPLNTHIRSRVCTNHCVSLILAVCLTRNVLLWGRASYCFTIFIIYEFHDVCECVCVKRVYNFVVRHWFVKIQSDLIFDVGRECVSMRTCVHQIWINK